MQQGKKLLLFLRRRFECGDAVGQRKPELGRLSFSSISQIYISGICLCFRFNPQRAGILFLHVRKGKTSQGNRATY